MEDEKKVYHPGHPDKENGKEMLEYMNEEHKPLRDFALERIHFEPGMRMLDVGCGGGEMIVELLKKSEGSKACGIDNSETSMEVASRTIAEALGVPAPEVSAEKSDSGALYQIGDRVQLHKADVTKLPAADGTYDLVTAVETTYFWPDIKAAFREIRRVLKVGGIFAVIVEGSDPDAHPDWPNPDHDIKIWQAQDFIDLFWQTGYGEIQVNHGDGDTLMVRGQKLANAEGFKGSFA